MTEEEARLQMLRDRQRLHGGDVATDALIAKLTKPSGRDTDGIELSDAVARLNEAASRQTLSRVSCQQ